MKTIIFISAMLLSATSYASSFMVGSWCGQDQLKTTDYKIVIDESDNFEISSKTEFNPSYSVVMTGVISQGASGASMITDSGVDLNLVEVNRDYRLLKRDRLIFNHRNPETENEYTSTYVKCD